MATNALELVSETVAWESRAVTSDEERHCPRCQQAVRGRFCGRCGAPVREARPPRCAWCGRETRGRFCTKCGKATLPASPPQPPVSPVVPAPLPARSGLRVERPRRQVRVVTQSPGPSLPDPVLAPDIFRQLYVGLELPADRDVIIGLTSAISGEGRTTCALGLARTLAMDQPEPVLLVEMDLEQPALASLLGLAAAPGLVDVLRGRCMLEEIMQPAGDNLLVVTAGVSGGEAAPLLQHVSSRLPASTLHCVAGMVILDLPPLLNVGYAPRVAEAADAIVLVVRAGVTPVELVLEGMARLGDRPPRGVVLNAFQSATPGWLGH